MSNRLIGYFLLSLAMMTVGSTVVASKFLVDDVSPFVATALRFAIALPFLFALTVYQKEQWPNLSRKEWGLLVLQAGAGSVGYTILLIVGLRYLPAADAGVIIGTLPAVSALFSVVVLGERPNLRLIVSVLLATLGVVTMAWTGGSPDSLFGSLCILGAVICESVFILLNKRMPISLSPLFQATAMTSLGLLVSLPFAALDIPDNLPPFPAVAAIVWYALVPTVGGFLLWYAGAARVSGSEAAIFTAVAPLTAVTLAALFLGERICARQVFGVLVVIFGILMLTLPVQTEARPS